MTPSIPGRGDVRSNKRRPPAKRTNRSSQLRSTAPPFEPRAGFQSWALGITGALYNCRSDVAEERTCSRNRPIVSQRSRNFSLEGRSTVALYPQFIRTTPKRIYARESSALHTNVPFQVSNTEAGETEYSEWAFPSLTQW